MRDRVEAFGRRDGGRLGELGVVDAVDAERAEVVSAVVVRGEVPASGVDDEPERAELAS